MPAHRKDFERAEQMYSSGASIAECAHAYGVSRQAMWKVLKRRGTDMRRLAPQPSTNWGDRKFTRRANGYFADTKNSRQYLHREVWANAFGSIPDGYEVHHKDGNKANNDLNNLALLSSEEHGRVHGFAGNQYVPSIGYRPIK